LPSWYKKDIQIDSSDKADFDAINTLKSTYDLIKIEDEQDLDKPYTVNNYASLKKDYDQARKQLDKYFKIEDLGEIKTAILNIKNPYKEESRQEDLQDDRDAYKNGYDGAFLADGDHFLVKSNTEQIHILGNKQDIAGFKKFVNAATTQPATSAETFDKKNLFKVTPKQAADKKAIIKASIATQYIGFGEGITGSSTESYRQQVLQQTFKQIPKVGDVVTMTFEIDYKDVEVAAKITALEINLEKSISNKGFAVDLENIKTGKKYEVYVDTDGSISQFVGKKGLKIGTDNYIKEFNIDAQESNIVNSGNYSADDVIFVSIPGKRGDASVAKREQDKTIKEAIKAVEAGATILTDNKAYTDASTYNTGEKRLYANMESKGYTYSEITVDGQLIGTWRKSTQPSTNPNQHDINNLPNINPCG
jgi:hypothetical protein